MAIRIITTESTVSLIYYDYLHTLPQGGMFSFGPMMCVVIDTNMEDPDIIEVMQLSSGHNNGRKLKMPRENWVMPVHVTAVTCPYQGKEQERETSDPESHYSFAHDDEVPYPGKRYDVTH